MLTYVCDAHENKKNNDKRVIGIAQLCLSALLKMDYRYTALAAALNMITILVSWLNGS